MQRATSAKLKVNFVGHVDKNTGYGRAARDWCRALLHHGDVDLGVDTLDEEGPGANELGLPLVHDYPDVVVIHERIPWAPGADPQQESLGDWLDCHDWAGRPVVLATAWEVRGLEPALSDYLSQYAAVVVPSEQAQRWLCHPMHQQIRHGARVRVVPHAFHIDFWHYHYAYRGNDHPFRFLYVGQWNDRKNPAGVLKAYLSAFGARDRGQVELRLHCPGMTEAQMLEANGTLAASGLRLEELPSLRITTEHLSDEDLRRLYWHSDVFVTAGRGEGFNLPAVEAAACGCRVLGNLAALPAFEDYLETDTRGITTIEGTMVPVFPGGTVRAVGGGVQYESFFPRGVTCCQQWSEPDLGRLASEMQGTAYDRCGDRAIQRSFLERFSYQSVGKQFGDLLREVVDKKGSR